MELIVKINHFNDLYILSNADSYLLSNKDFSYRFDESFNKAKIISAVKYCHKNNKKVYFLINKIFKNKDLEKLETFIKFLINEKIDGIFFTDFAVYMIAKDNNFSSHCYFCHETFLRNSKDIKTYQDYGIENVICSKDMNIDDILNLQEEKKDNYGIICFGYYMLYESERKIISNFTKNHNINQEINNSKELYLKEETRDEKYKVLQQNGISSIFDSKVLSYLSYTKTLSKNINMFIIDALFFDSKYIYEVIDFFKRSLLEDNLDEKLKELDPSIDFTDGFLMKRVGLM